MVSTADASPHTSPRLLQYINKSANELENSLTAPVVCRQRCGTPEHLFQFTPQHCGEALQGPGGRQAFCGVVGGLDLMLVFFR